MHVCFKTTLLEANHYHVWELYSSAQNGLGTVGLQWRHRFPDFGLNLYTVAMAMDLYLYDATHVVTDAVASGMIFSMLQGIFQYENLTQNTLRYIPLSIFENITCIWQSVFLI